MFHNRFGNYPVECNSQRTVRDMERIDLSMTALPASDAHYLHINTPDGQQLALNKTACLGVLMALGIGFDHAEWQKVGPLSYDVDLRLRDTNNDLLWYSDVYAPGTVSSFTVGDVVRVRDTSTGALAVASVEQVYNIFQHGADGARLHIFMDTVTR